MCIIGLTEDEVVTDQMVDILEVTGRVSQNNRQDLYPLFSVIYSPLSFEYCDLRDLTSGMVDLRVQINASNSFMPDDITSLEGCRELWSS